MKTTESPHYHSSPPSENPGPPETTHKIHWINTIFLTLSPIAAIIAAFIYIKDGSFRVGDLILFMTMSLATGLSITAGYHRLFAHRAYKSHWSIELLYLLFGAAALQNSALDWCDDHRRHHKFVDTDKDPYNIKKGFLHAHILWILKTKLVPSDYKGSHDLVQNRLLMWQYRHYFKIGIVVGFLLPTLIGWAYGSALGGFLFGGLVRVVVLHHGTFLINSAAHVFGKQPYSKKNSSRDNFFLALLTYGEGYHNFHHAFQADYRNGIRFYHWDPSKWLIYSLHLIGLASGLKRTPEWAISRARLKIHKERADSILRNMEPSLADLVLQKIKEAEELIQDSFNRWRDTKQRYQKWGEEKRSFNRADRTSLERFWKKKLATCKTRAHLAARELIEYIALMERHGAITT